MLAEPGAGPEGPPNPPRRCAALAADSQEQFAGALKGMLLASDSNCTGLGIKVLELQG